MAWIETITEAQAEGPLKELYDMVGKQAGSVANILKIASLNPGALEGYLHAYKSIMFAASPLSRAQREMLATVTSRTNSCHY